MKPFRPNLDILPSSQKTLWHHLSATPDCFVLYGGTAIALRLGHRQSIDFDFFTHQTFQPDALYKGISYLKGAEITQRGQDTLTCLVHMPEITRPVKVSYFGGLSQKIINPAEKAEDNGIKIASLLDLFGMKCVTVADRITSKDYIDIHAILQRTKLQLSDGLAAAKAIYGKAYQPLMTTKALSFFKGGDLTELDDLIKQDLLKAVQTTDISKLLTLTAVNTIGQSTQKGRDKGDSLCL